MLQQFRTFNNVPFYMSKLRNLVMEHFSSDEAQWLVCCRIDQTLCLLQTLPH